MIHFVVHMCLSRGAGGGATSRGSAVCARGVSSEIRDAQIRFAPVEGIAKWIRRTGAMQQAVDSRNTKGDKEFHLERHIFCCAVSSFPKLDMFVPQGRIHLHVKAKGKKRRHCCCCISHTCDMHMHDYP